MLQQLRVETYTYVVELGIKRSRGTEHHYSKWNTNEVFLHFYWYYYGKENKAEEMDWLRSNSKEITNVYTISTEKSEKKKTSKFLDADGEFNSILNQQGGRV